ncbi:MAG TPA: response regulator transcription factor, partial [Gaiellaceae bacterium]|nr:response regulator transcription factor [Gaiellaceae bacterium]
ADAAPVTAGNIGAMRILLVEDEDAIAEPLADGLRREGFEVERAATGSAALAAAESDLVLLDLRLPDLDGLDVCRRLRERSDVPIIVVTARGEEADRVVGLELGADDYVVKPFGIRELIARIRAVTRRTSVRNSTVEPLRVGALEVDERARRATLDGRDLELTPKEFDLLAALARDPGAAISRRRLLEEVWETTWYGSAKTIDVHVAALRRKLGDPGWIETVRGVGFRLRAD